MNDLTSPVFAEAWSHEACTIAVACDAQGRVVAVSLRGREGLASLGVVDAGHDPAQTGEARRQLEAYFRGERREFDLELAPRIGTAFQQKVWAALAAIPYGQTWSYSRLAAQVGSVARAVGGANGANPIPIIWPCHRVIGADGTLTGYAGGLALKAWLLRLEGAVLPVSQGELF